MTYFNLLNENENPTYADLLFTFEWKEKREEILKRDNFCCNRCKVRYVHADDSHLYFRDMNEEERKNYISEQMNNQSVREWHEWLEDEHKKLNKKYRPQYTFPLLKKNPEQNITFNALHVHHTYYILNKLPWEYRKESLIALCGDCHKKLHEHELVDVFRDESQLTKVDVTKCDRCVGTGELQQYRHIQDGICFKCWGKGYNAQNEYVA